MAMSLLRSTPIDGLADYLQCQLAKRRWHPLSGQSGSQPTLSHRSSPREPVHVWRSKSHSVAEDMGQPMQMGFASAVAALVRFLTAALTDRFQNSQAHSRARGFLNVIKDLGSAYERWHGGC
ncbi:hypothetical protein ACVIGB_008177 [Bradyrhizobium sp. USDA 4341]